jgi:carbon monoxide dehydrogenase subunit G
MWRHVYLGVFTALALAVSAPAVWATDATPAVAEEDVLVQRSGQGFTVDLSFYVPVAPAQAWAVLTDFEHMPEFLPNLTSSHVSKLGDNELKVSQTGVAKYGVFSANFESIREITLTPETEIHAHGIGGNLQHLESVMHLHPEGNGTKLVYHVEAMAGFWFPPLIGPSLVRHDTAAQFSAMVREMQRR